MNVLLFGLIKTIYSLYDGFQNYHGEFIELATDFVFQRKAIFGEEGLAITGQHLLEL